MRAVSRPSWRPSRFLVAALALAVAVTQDALPAQPAQPPATARSVTFPDAPRQMTVGDSVLVVPTVRDAAGRRLSGRALRWYTSDSLVAVVRDQGPDGGYVIARDSGRATIGATWVLASGTEVPGRYELQVVARAVVAPPTPCRCDTTVTPPPPVDTARPPVPPTPRRGDCSWRKVECEFDEAIPPSGPEFNAFVVTRVPPAGEARP